mgnify:CR=1 FL=1
MASVPHRATSASMPLLFIAGPFRYDTSTLRFYKDGAEIVLSSKENAMMKLFLDNVNRIFTKDMIYDQGVVVLLAPADDDDGQADSPAPEGLNHLKAVHPRHIHVHRLGGLGELAVLPVQQLPLALGEHAGHGETLIDGEVFFAIAERQTAADSADRILVLDAAERFNRPIRAAPAITSTPHRAI